MVIDQPGPREAEKERLTDRLELPEPELGSRRRVTELDERPAHRGLRADGGEVLAIE